MSREGLPLRDPLSKSFLYEVPTAKPTYVYGFDAEHFNKSEQSQLNGALIVSGTVVDFERSEVSVGRTGYCPFLAFEKFDILPKRDVESARNQCVIAGAQYLRGQQQLFHSATGLPTISQPLITFTCAISNEYAVINLHSIEEDGSYATAAVCRFNFEDGQHSHTFQACMEAVESWSSLYLLSQVKIALSEVVQYNQTPPLSLVSSSGNLSIDTNPDNTILNSLRRYWPEAIWRSEGIGETPINSSIAQCGTPLPAHNLYSRLLPRTPSDNPLQSQYPFENDNPPLPKRQLERLSPLRTNLLPSHRYPTPRRFGALSSVSRSMSDSTTTTPNSPCRLPSLSPTTPGPEAPVSSKGPMLVLQKRLDIAMNEI